MISEREYNTVRLKCSYYTNERERAGGGHYSQVTQRDRGVSQKRGHIVSLVLIYMSPVNRASPGSEILSLAGKRRLELL